MGEEKFNEKGVGFSSITIKKNEKINMNKLGVALKLKTNRDYYAYEVF